VDNKEYLVRNTGDKQEAANLMSNIRIKLNNLKIHLESKYPDKPQVQQLKRNFEADPSRFIESTPDSELDLDLEVDSDSSLASELAWFLASDVETNNLDQDNLDKLETELDPDGSERDLFDRWQNDTITVAEPEVETAKSEILESQFAIPDIDSEAIVDIPENLPEPTPDFIEAIISAPPGMLPFFLAEEYSGEPVE
jgi:hypothetical protein